MNDSSDPTRSAAEVYEELVRHHPEIRTLFVKRYRNPPRIEERAALNKADVALVEHARETKNRTALPFWDALFATCLSEEYCSRQITRAAVYHQEPIGELLQLASRDVAAGALRHLIVPHDQEDLIAVCSKVTLANGEDRHFAMLDFHCAPSVANQRLVVEISHVTIGSPAAILRSGASYHAIGLKLLSERALMQFIGTALLFPHAVDRQYLGHQLIDGYLALRISPGVADQPAPRIVEWL